MACLLFKEKIICFVSSLEYFISNYKTIKLTYFFKECSNEEELAKSLGKRPLSSSSMMRCKDILVQLAPYYKYHGINIKSSYSDFDQHNIGLVTESQVCINPLLYKILYEYFC